MSSKSMPWIFKILFQTKDIRIFVFRGVFLVDSSFPDEKKTSAVKSEANFSRKAIEN